MLELFAVLENPAGDRPRYAGDEFLPGERFPQQPVAQLDNGPIRLERFVEGVGVGEGVFVQQVEQGEQVVALHLDRRCREQHQTLADRPQQPAQFVGLGFLVAQVMGLVNDDHVEDRLVEGLFLENGSELAGGPVGSPFRRCPPRRPQPLDAGDQGHFLHLATEQFFDGLIHLLGIAYLRLDAKTIEQFILPFFAEHGRTDNEQALGVHAGAEFGPDQAGLDRLAEADLIGDENAVARGIQELEYRFELVGEELGIGGVQAVDEVGQPAAEAVVGDGAAQVPDPAVAAALQERKGSHGLAGHLFQGSHEDKFLIPVIEAHQHPAPVRRPVVFVRQCAHARRICANPDLVSWFQLTHLACPLPVFSAALVRCPERGTQSSFASSPGIFFKAAPSLG